MGNFFSDAWNSIFDPGKDDRKKSNELYQQSINNQASTEAWQRGLMEDRLKLANQLLFGGNIQNPLNAGADGVNSSPGVDVKGALPTMQSWEDKFYNFLENSPDTTYNRQRGTLEKGMKDANKALTSQLNRRGLSNTVLGQSKFGDLGYNKAVALAGLEGERMDRKGDRISKGLDYSRSVLDSVLSMGNNASGVAGSFSSRVPTLLQGYGNTYANQAANAGQGFGNVLLEEAGQNMFDRMFPTRTQTPPAQQQAGGVGQEIAKKAIFSIPW